MRVSPSWLALREPADAEARSADLVAPLRRRLGGTSRLVIHDLGCGTGSMARWLAPQLPGPQHWVLYDQDSDLLELAAKQMVERGADGTPVAAETRLGDATRLESADIEGASLVTASALLDLLTATEVDRIAAACAGARCPALLTLSVAGRVNLAPSDPLDDEISAAFNDHQRRTTAGRRLLGPDAVPATVAAFDRRGATVSVRPSLWLLGPRTGPLLAEWFDGWLSAACEQRPELAAAAATYRRRRAGEIRDGRLAAVVHHVDILTWPAGPEWDPERVPGGGDNA